MNIFEIVKKIWIGDIKYQAGILKKKKQILLSELDKTSDLVKLLELNSDIAKIDDSLKKLRFKQLMKSMS